MAGTISNILNALLKIHNKQKQIYTKLHAHYGESHLSLHWTNREIQYKRFEAFLRMGDLSGKRVLDVGCGLADFYEFLTEKKIDVQYTGYDIVASFIERNQKKYPSAKFECRDILLFKPEEKFDYVFISGVFAFGDKLFFEEMSRRAFRLAEIALGFNIYMPEDKNFFKISRENTKKYCETLKPQKITVVDDYLNDDFSVFLYK